MLTPALRGIWQKEDLSDGRGWDEMTWRVIGYTRTPLDHGNKQNKPDISTYARPHSENVSNDRFREQRRAVTKKNHRFHRTVMQFAYLWKQ